MTIIVDQAMGVRVIYKEAATEDLINETTVTSEEPATEEGTVDEAVDGAVDEAVDGEAVVDEGATEGTSTEGDSIEGDVSVDGESVDTEGMDSGEVSVDGGDVSMEGGDVYSEDGMMEEVGADSGSGAKDPLLSSWPFVIGITAATLAVSIVLGILLGKKRIKKGIDLYEN